MAFGSAEDASARQELSSLVDGELDPGRVAATCAAWRDDPQLRATWHAYHLIGDVLRSDDLATRPVRDAAFLGGLRARLAAEPVVLAPETVTVDAQAADTPGVRVGGARGGRWAWKAPSAVAAGFVLVAGALVVTRGFGPADAPVQVAQPIPAASPTTALVAGPSLPPVPPPSALVDAPAPATRVAGRLLRDPQLDRYLAAHQQFAGTSALGMPPSGFLRNAAADAPNR